MTTQLIEDRCQEITLFVRERALAGYPAPSNIEIARALGVSTNVIHKTLPHVYTAGEMKREGHNHNYRFVFPDGLITSYRKHSAGPPKPPSRRPSTKIAVDIVAFWGGDVAVTVGPGGTIRSDMLNGLPRKRA